jgi:hypothetical protein
VFGRRLVLLAIAAAAIAAMIARAGIALAATAPVQVGAVAIAREEPHSCGPSGDYAYPQETLRDWVSFFDQLSVVRAVDERRAGPLKDPDGAGYVGRHVTVEVERTLWRRDGAAQAPRRFEFVDIGWWQERDGSLRVSKPCGETRMAVGRRYLAIVGRHRGRWFPGLTGRLRLRGPRVVGGVDEGHPAEAHAALTGMRVRAAADLVAAAQPYRAAVAHADWGPVARFRAAARDGYQ